MIRQTTLFATPELQIARYDHPPGHHHHDPKEEVAQEHSVNRVESGHFILEIEGRHWELRRGDLFLNYPGIVYRCRHVELEPTDVCVSIAFVRSRVDEQIAAFERTARQQPVRPPSNRLAYLFLLVGRANNVKMAAEEAAHEAIAEAAGESCPTKRPFGEHQLRWYAERVDAVKRQIDRHYPAEQRLSNLARSVGMSPFHFARIFRELVGVPPHSYLCRVRLRHAARSLREGTSVTEACFASGFQNLSHFCRQFHRHFGIRPSNYSDQTL